MNSLNIYRNKNINYNNKKYIPLNNGVTGYQLGLNKKQKYICAIFIFIVLIIFIYQAQLIRLSKLFIYVKNIKLNILY